uniref:Uncharacterized protein n=1 Tax=Candidatus Magnetananas rongchengensis TaxID=1463558 RepID=A0A3S6IW45_9BACT|nr:hypothetical protein [Candidatus Magnetananas rongchenensis]
MLIIKIVGFVIISSIIIFTVVLVKNASKIEREIELEKMAKKDERDDENEDDEEHNDKDDEEL